MHLDAVKAKIALDKGMMEAADDGVRAKVRLDKAALRDLRDDVLDRLPDLPGIRRTPKPRNAFQAVQFKIWDVEDEITDVMDGSILPFLHWVQRSWADRPWAPHPRTFPRVGFGHLAMLLIGSGFGALAVYMVNTRLNQGEVSTTMDEAMRQTEDAIGSRWNRPAGSAAGGSGGFGQAGWPASTGMTGGAMTQTGRPYTAPGAAGEKDVPHEEWEQFCENFSRQNRGARLTVDRRGQTVVRDQPFIALSFESSDGGPAFRILTGDRAGEHLAHVVSDVTRVQLLTRGGGRDEGLRFHGGDGETTVRLQE